MKTANIITALGALAHEYRLAIYRLLVEQGPAGLPAGAIGERMGLTPSSLTFHLQSLQRAVTKALLEAAQLAGGVLGAILLRMFSERRVPA